MSEQVDKYYCEVVEHWITGGQNGHSLVLLLRGRRGHHRAFFSLTGRGREVTEKMLDDYDYREPVADLNWNRALVGRHGELYENATEGGKVYLNFRSPWGKFRASQEEVDQWEAPQ